MSGALAPAAPTAASRSEEEITVEVASPGAEGRHVEEPRAVDSSCLSCPVLLLPAASSLAKSTQVLLVQSSIAVDSSLDGLQALLVVPASSDSTNAPKEQARDNTCKAARELRGWLMVLATVIASITYASGLSPPGGFQDGDWPGPSSPPMTPVLRAVSPRRYKTFYYCNTAAFALSLSIVVLLASQDLRRLAKIKVLEILVALDVLALLVAYIVGSTFGLRELGVCAGLVLIVPVALVVMSSRVCGRYFWDEL